MLSYSELDNVEKEILQKELLQDVRIKRIDFTGDMDEQIYDQAYVNTLSNWGVACPHPTGALKRSTYSFFCETCRCDIIIPGMAKLAKQITKATK
jgi:hypothetical protein